MSAEVMVRPMLEVETNLMADRDLQICLEANRQMLAAVIHDHVLFTSLDEEQRSLMIAAFHLQNNCRGDTIIRQGEDGHLFYVVKSGTLCCSVRTSSTAGSSTRVCAYGPNEAFGELALLYNQPRAATVVVDSEECLLWAISREAYLTILQHTYSLKKQLYLQCLTSVPLLKTLDDEEIAKLIDILQPRKYGPGDVMAREGEAEDSLFILLQGSAVATTLLGDHELRSYVPGDFFGEMSLMTQQLKPRAATVTATVASTACIIGKESFSRLLGPCEELVHERLARDESSTPSLGAPS